MVIVHSYSEEESGRVSMSSSMAATAGALLRKSIFFLLCLLRSYLLSVRLLFNLNYFRIVMRMG